ncbi:T6SS effector BTH_I2691 family protein [Providencia sp. PROV149]|uniref:T6SS effector BTH_I2691 family protein n=1 Tax=Providencia sp. PROV149 TaxID=2949859 RepID=UPI0023495015|nr:T6SS effector BTH_I2691 family protein [Providencia sp. PROV149]
MSQSPKREGCHFCQRRGLPILPVRPAIMSQHDILPVMPESIQVPIPAQGETAYTLRLMRSGYLNIWDEFGNAWINYFVTEGGFFYPLPENGDVPDEVASGKIKPCIDQPEELAKASLVTLPVMPDGMKNGLFWFAWSEVKWTETIRKQFEDKSHRERYMQPFDMDAWLNTQSTAQTLPLSELENTIADYSQHVKKSQMWKWSALIAQLDLLEGLKSLVYPITSKFSPIATGQQVEMTAHQDLHPNGALLVLQDPTGILRDLPTLIEYELDKHVYQRPDIKRQVMLLGAISGVKNSIRDQFQENYITTTLREAAYIKSIDTYPDGDITVELEEDELDSAFIQNRRAMIMAKTQAHWAEYEQYYNTEAYDAFNLRFQSILEEYNTRVVSPRTQLYLDWFQSPTLMHYFQQHFDTRDLISGIAYTATVSYCIIKMSDKKGSLDYFSSSLLKSLSDPTNILGRALVFNQDALIKKIDEATQSSVDMLSLNWAGLADAFAKLIEPHQITSQNIMAVYLGNLATVVMNTVDKAMSSEKMYGFVAALGAFSNKAIIPVRKAGTYRHFVKDVVNTLVRLSDHNHDLNENEIRKHVYNKLKRLKVAGLPMEQNRILKYWIDIDTSELDRIKLLTPKEQEKALSQLLQLHSETESASIARMRTSMTSGKGKSGMVIGAGIVSGILQSVALFHSVDLENKKTLPEEVFEAHNRFYAGVAGVVSASVGLVEEGMKRFASFDNLAQKMLFRNSTAFKSLVIGIGKGVGIAAGVVSSAFDIYHANEERKKKNIGLFIAYSLSGASGIWLTVIIFSKMLAAFAVLTLLAVLIMIGAAIYIAIEGQNKIQKWLEQCLWRQVPAHIPQSEWPDIYPTMAMEMDAFERALG